MQSRLLLLAFALAPLTLAACGSGGGTSAPATPQPPASTKPPPTKAMTITVMSVQTTSRSHDQAPKGTSRGDKVEFANVLLSTSAQFGKAANQTIGSDTGTLTFTSASTARIDGVATLPDGTIVFKGAVTVLPNNTVSIPIVGGTGTYANASGTLHVGTGSKRAANTYRIVVGDVRGPVA